VAESVGKVRDAGIGAVVLSYIFVKARFNAGGAR
jgi:hypothetical protein